MVKIKKTNDRPHGQRRISANKLRVVYIKNHVIPDRYKKDMKYINIIRNGPCQEGFYARTLMTQIFLTASISSEKKTSTHILYFDIAPAATRPDGEHHRSISKTSIPSPRFPYIYRLTTVSTSRQHDIVTDY